MNLKDALLKSSLSRWAVLLLESEEEFMRQVQKGSLPAEFAERLASEVYSALRSGDVEVSVEGQAYPAIDLGAALLRGPYELPAGAEEALLMNMGVALEVVPVHRIQAAAARSVLVSSAVLEFGTPAQLRALVEIDPAIDHAHAKGAIARRREPLDLRFVADKATNAALLSALCWADVPELDLALANNLTQPGAADRLRHVISRTRELPVFHRATASLAQLLTRGKLPEEPVLFDFSGFSEVADLERMIRALQRVHVENEARLKRGGLGINEEHTALVARAGAAGRLRDIAMTARLSEEVMHTIWDVLAKVDEESGEKGLHWETCDILLALARNPSLTDALATKLLHIAADVDVPTDRIAASLASHPSLSVEFVSGLVSEATDRVRLWEEIEGWPGLNKSDASRRATNGRHTILAALRAHALPSYVVEKTFILTSLPPEERALALFMNHQVNADLRLSAIAEIQKMDAARVQKMEPEMRDIAIWAMRGHMPVAEAVRFVEKHSILFNTSVAFAFLARYASANGVTLDEQVDPVRLYEGPEWADDLAAMEVALPRIEAMLRSYKEGHRAAAPDISREVQSFYDMLGRIRADVALRREPDRPLPTSLDGLRTRADQLAAVFQTADGTPSDEVEAEVIVSRLFDLAGNADLAVAKAAKDTLRSESLEVIRSRIGLGGEKPKRPRTMG